MSALDWERARMTGRSDFLDRCELQVARGEPLSETQTRHLWLMLQTVIDHATETAWRDRLKRRMGARDGKRRAL